MDDHTISDRITELKSALNRKGVIHRRFPKHLEDEYQNYLKRDFLSTERFLSTSLVAIFFGFVLIDISMYMDVLHPLVISRSVFSVINAVVVYLMFFKRVPWLTRNPMNIAAGLHIMGCACICLGSFLCEKPLNYIYFTGILPLIFATAINFRNSSRQPLVALPIMLVISLSSMFAISKHNPYPEGDLLGFLLNDVYLPLFSIFLVLCAMMAMYIPFMVSKTIRTQWLSNQVIELESESLKRLTAKLSKLSNKDDLTDIANRRRFMEALKKAHTSCASTQKPLSLIMLDVDYFKRYNDSYGHDAGDVALRIISAILKKHAQRNNDLPARYGGEEFMVLLPNANAMHAKKVAEAIRNDIINEQLTHKGSPLGHVTASLGVITAHATPTSIEELITKADSALYESKNRGRNRVCVHA